jgi:phosphatidylethanolamine-binding protein (PEBP) family uncharacterized protein
VAQRTGDKRLLASPAKGTSAGFCLALVLAGLLLSGCGGGSSSGASAEASSAGSSTASAGTAAQADGDAAAATGSGGAQRQGAAKQADPAPGTSTDPAAKKDGQKHGPRIAQPKAPPEQAPTPAQLARATVADMSLTSPSLPAGTEGIAPILATYTCDGKGSWPAFGWSGVPAGTAELIFYAMNSQPVEGKLFVDWAVAGLDPALSGIEAGKLPKGAIIGTNGFGKPGYEICPPSGGGEIYIFAVYALPRALSPKPGFDGRELRKEILDVSGNAGLYSAAYQRG